MPSTNTVQIQRRQLPLWFDHLHRYISCSHLSAHRNGFSPTPFSIIPSRTPYAPDHREITGKKKSTRSQATFFWFQDQQNGSYLNVDIESLIPYKSWEIKNITDLKCCWSVRYSFGQYYSYFLKDWFMNWLPLYEIQWGMTPFRIK